MQEGQVYVSDAGAIHLSMQNFLSSHHLQISYTDLPAEDLLKIDASSSNQPCASFGVNKYIGQDFVDLYAAGEVVFLASTSFLCY
jgi:hypothetical protein